MNARCFLIAAALLAAPAIAGSQPATAAAGIKHSFFMRGSVVVADGGGIVVCVGKIDGAREGQVLNVFRTVYRPGPRNSASFSRTKIGTVRVDSHVNDHFSNASVLTGDVKMHDIVELKRSVD